MYEVPFEMPCSFHSVSMFVDIFYGLFCTICLQVGFEAVVPFWKCDTVQLVNNDTGSGQPHGLTRVPLLRGLRSVFPVKQF